MYDSLIEFFNKRSKKELIVVAVVAFIAYSVLFGS